MMPPTQSFEPLLACPRLKSEALIAYCLLPNPMLMAPRVALQGYV